MTKRYPAHAIQWRRGDGHCYCYRPDARAQCRTPYTERVRFHFLLRARSETINHEDVVTVADFYVCAACADTLTNLNFFHSRSPVEQETKRYG